MLDMREMGNKNFPKSQNILFQYFYAINFFCNAQNIFFKFPSVFLIWPGAIFNIVSLRKLRTSILDNPSWDGFYQL